MQSFTNSKILKNGVRLEADEASVERIKYIKKVFPTLGGNSSFTDLGSLTQDDYEENEVYQEPFKVTEDPIVIEAPIKQELLDEQYNLGYDEGYGKALQSMQEQVEMRDVEYERLFTEFESYKQVKSYSLQNFEEGKQEFISKIESDIMKLIINSCEKILKTKLSEDEVVLHMLKETMDELKGKSDVLIRVHPKVIETYSNFKNELQTQYEKINIAFTEDLTLSEFGCVIETEENQYDLQLPTQMEKIKEVLEHLI